MLGRSERPVCLALGNCQITEDSGGIYLGRGLKTLGIKLIEGGLYPENRLEQVAMENPDLVILADAVKSDTESDYIITDDLISDLTTSTHTLPLSSLASYLKIRTGSKVIFFGINRKVAREDIDNIIAKIRDAVYKSE